MSTAPATPVTGQTSHTEITTIRIARILVVAVLSYDVIILFLALQTELALSMSYPDTNLVATEATKHHAVVLWNGETHVARLKLMTVVVHHLANIMTIRR